MWTLQCAKALKGRNGSRMVMYLQPPSKKTWIFFPSPIYFLRQVVSSRISLTFFYTFLAQRIWKGTKVQQEGDDKFVFEIVCCLAQVLLLETTCCCLVLQKACPNLTFTLGLSRIHQRATSKIQVFLLGGCRDSKSEWVPKKDQQSI